MAPTQINRPRDLQTFHGARAQLYTYLYAWVRRAPTPVAMVNAATVASARLGAPADFLPADPATSTLDPAGPCTGRKAARYQLLMESYSITCRQRAIDDLALLVRLCEDTVAALSSADYARAAELGETQCVFLESHAARCLSNLAGQRGGTARLLNWLLEHDLEHLDAA